LKSVRSIYSRIAVLKEHLGELPLDALDEPDDINRFKTESDYAEEVELATIHRTLETLRAAMNWGMAQTPLLFRKSPFHRFGVRMNKKAETMRDRRLLRDEEKMLLDAALQKMNTPQHQFVGPLLHDRIIGALELCCRRGEMLLIQNKRVNWETCQIGIPGATVKDKENRRIPFNPEGRLVAILRRRSALEPEAFVFGRRPARTSQTSKRRGKHYGSSRMASSPGQPETAPNRTASSCSGSISAGMTFGMKEQPVSWPMASTSASSN
jgi:integrase